MVEHGSANPRALGSIFVLVSNIVIDYDEAEFMHFTPGVVHNFTFAFRFQHEK